MKIKPVQLRESNVNYLGATTAAYHAFNCFMEIAYCRRKFTLCFIKLLYLLNVQKEILKTVVRQKSAVKKGSLIY